MPRYSYYKSTWVQYHPYPNTSAGICHYVCMVRPWLHRTLICISYWWSQSYQNVGAVIPRTYSAMAINDMYEILRRHFLQEPREKGTLVKGSWNKVEDFELTRGNRIRNPLHARRCIWKELNKPWPLFGIWVRTSMSHTSRYRSRNYIKA